MEAQKIILNVILRVCSIILPLFPQKKNRVTFISLTSNKLTGDMKQIVDQLQKKDNLDIKFVLFKYEHTVWSSILYLFNCIYQLFIINTSNIVVINDNNYVISTFKKRNVKVIQIWHACGAVKKFGNEIERKYPIKNYDYVISCSNIWKSVYANSFNVDEKNVLSLGMPRTDYLLYSAHMRKLKEEMYKKFPVLKNKYVVLYAPTFRGNIIDGMYHLPIDLDNIIRRLPNDIMIIYKMHPLLKDVRLGTDERIVKMNDEELYSLFSIADCLISDYSSVIFDFSLLGRKEIYYVPDLEEYKKTIGLNVDFTTFPGEVCYSEDTLIKAIANREFENMKIVLFSDQYFTHKDAKSSERIAKFIIDLMKGKNYIK